MPTVPHPGDHADRAHVFVSDLTAPQLDEADEHHLRRSLRLVDGAVITIADGAGRWCEARLGSDVEPVGPVWDCGPARPEITIGLPAVKGDRTEWAVQKMTEVGVDRIVILDAARSVVRWRGDRGARHLDRLRRVAREAAMQSRRVTIPTITGVISPAEMIGSETRGAVAIAQRGGEEPSISVPNVLVGPEGGWTEEELSLTPMRVNLSGNVLRVETAALVAAVSLTQLRGANVDDRGEC